MPIIGTNLAASAAGAPGAERAASRRPERAETTRSRARRPDKDEVIVGASAVDAPEAVRSLKGNDQEETREDREEHAAYTSRGKVASRGPSKLDLAG